MNRVTFATSGELADHAAAFIVRTADDAIRQRGRFVLALSGGETPRPVYSRLADAAGAFRIDWPLTHVVWTDERAVPAGDPQSNVTAARDTLLGHVPIPEQNVYPIELGSSVIETADTYEMTLRRLLGPQGRIDLMLLGLGADGHTASLFPRHQALKEDARWVLPVHTPAAPPWRITMTLPLMNAARGILFLVTGEEKAAAVRKLLAGENLPAAHVRPKDGSVTWFLDSAASAEA